MEEIVFSPVKGIVIPLEKVPDEMFAKKLLGDGIAIDPMCEEWFIPIEGVVTVIYETKHAIGITSTQGSELLIHIGLDTFDLKGVPFDMKVKVNDYVHVGDPMVHVNLAYIKEKGYDSIVPLISTNRAIRAGKITGKVDVGDVLFQIEC